MVDESNSGHRARLRERFEKGGITAFHDYEILELLLTYALPRRDTKPLAKRLLDTFGSVGSVLGADPARLSEIPGIGPNAAGLLALIHQVSSYCLRERISQRDAISGRRSIEEYLRFRFGAASGEFVAALFLDTANKVIDAEMIAEGTVNQCVIYPRELVSKALTSGAAGIILAHNHPAGTMQPSEADWDVTRRLHQVGRLLDLPLIDHIIVSRDSVLSLRELPRWPQ